MNLYSTHIFLFPFQWYFTGKEMENANLEKRTDLPRFIKLFENSLWKRKDYKTDTVLAYNEYNYFYDVVRDTLFDKTGINDKSIIANLFYNIEPEEYTFNFTVSKFDESLPEKQYSLNIESIILHLYSTGVGVLSFHLNNRLENQKELSDILRINQYARRIYPPFFGIPNELAAESDKYNYSNFAEGLKATQGKELAKSMWMIDPNWCEDFSEYKDPNVFKSNPFRLPRHISPLFRGIDLVYNADETHSETTKVFMSPLLDDRMFTICWYGNDELAKELSTKTKQPYYCFCKDDYPYKTNEKWYRFLFNDQKYSTCQNEQMMEELINKHTYSRWIDYETLYGVNRYSFVCVTGTLESLCKPDVNAAFLVNHMQTMYYKLIELCLVQRACILRFSDEVARISAMDETRKIPLAERVSSLYKQYIRFVNRIYFREITAQEQGIEIYNLAQKVMGITDNVKDLDDEISELHQYVSIVEEQKANRSLSKLTSIGALFVIPSFLAGFFGMNFFGSNISDSNWAVIACIFGAMAVLAGILFYSYRRVNKNIKSFNRK